MSDLDVRPAQEADLVTIAAIYNDVMQTSSTIWSEQPVSVAERRKWLSQASAVGHPILVAFDSSGVLGFVSAEPFRPWTGYAAHSSTRSMFIRTRGLAESADSCSMRWKPPFVPKVST
jgi:L-amino acid N-acyltransferase YncA